MKVWRIEHVSRRHGPFATVYDHNGVVDTAIQHAWPLLPKDDPQAWHDPREMPTPRDEPELRAFASKISFLKRNYLFAFPSKRSLVKWFPRKWRRALAQVGFTVRVYDVIPVAVGRHNVIYPAKLNNNNET